jgi:DNA-binding transcriptional regulator YdaS (Cro superfamily)
MGGPIHLAFEVFDLDAAIARGTAAGGRLVARPVPDVSFQWAQDRVRLSRRSSDRVDRTTSVGITGTEVRPLCLLPNALSLIPARLGLFGADARLGPGPR